MKALQLEFLKPIEKAARRLIKYEVDHVRKAVDRHLVRSASSFEKWMEDFYVGMTTEIDKTIGPVFDKYIKRTKKTGVDLINADINQFPALKKWKRKYIEGYTLRHIGSSSGQLLEILKNTPIEDVQKVFGTRLDEWLEKRPGKIARNEVIKASNATLRETYRIGGVTKLKWINTGSKSCDFCRGLNNKIVGIESNFIEHDEVLEGKTGSGRKLKIYGPKAHPPIHAFCQCSVIPVFEAGSVVKGFVKAKTIKEAEKWALKNGGGAYKYSDNYNGKIHKIPKERRLDSANMINEEIARMQSLGFPVESEKIILINEGGLPFAGSNAYGKDVTICYEYLYKQKAYFDKGVKKFKVEILKDQLEEVTLKDIIGKSIVYENSGPGLIRHEYGHGLIRKTYKDKDLKKLYGKHKDFDWYENVSDYARDAALWGEPDVTDAMAEAFSIYTSKHYKAGTFPTWLEDSIEKLKE